MIQFRNTEIGHKEVLLNIEHLTLEQGKVYALVGRNGIGKSTLLQTMTKMISLLSGEIQYEGIDFEKLSKTQMARVIAYVESKFDGVEYLTVFDYLSLGRAPYTSLTGKLSLADKLIIDEITSDLNIGHLLEKNTNNISDGERQICAVARALIQETPIILMDEPTAFLDYINRQKLIEILVRVAEEKQKCIIMSTHDIDLCLENKIPFLIASRGKVTIDFYEDKKKLIEMFES